VATPPDAQAPWPITPRRAIPREAGRAAAALPWASPGGCRPKSLNGSISRGSAPGGERITRHAAPKSDEDQAAAEASGIARYKDEHLFASASEINTERTRIRATSPGVSRPYYDITSSASKSISVLHASLRVAATQAREDGDEIKAAALDAEAQAIESALLDSVREGLELLEAMGCYVRTGHHSATTGEWRDGKGPAGVVFPAAMAGPQSLAFGGVELVQAASPW
jgi:hypothetical protein